LIECRPGATFSASNPRFQSVAELPRAQPGDTLLIYGKQSALGLNTERHVLSGATSQERCNGGMLVEPADQIECTAYSGGRNAERNVHLRRTSRPGSRGARERAS
jgi:hypothetical protein